MKAYINYVKLTNGKFNNSNAREKVAFCYKKSFPWNHCVTTCRFAYLHTVTAWQATVSTETRTWKFCFLEQMQFLMTSSTLFTHAKCTTSHRIAEFSNKIIQWKATCLKPPFHERTHERSWSLTNKQIQQLKCPNLHQDLHKTATSLIHRMNCRAAPFICENLGT